MGSLFLRNKPVVVLSAVALRVKYKKAQQPSRILVALGLLRSVLVISKGCIWCYAAIAAHQKRHFFNSLQWEGRCRQGTHGDGHQLHGVVVCGNTVRVEFAAATATVNDSPLAAFAGPNGHGFHHAATIRLPVARLVVHMQAAQAVCAVVAVLGACVFGRHQPVAHFAGEAIVAGVGFVVSFLICFSFVFSVQGVFLQKSVDAIFFERLGLVLVQTSRVS